MKPTLGTDHVCPATGGTGVCTNLQCQIDKPGDCSAGTATTISGSVFDPAGKNPLYNVLVYVPNTALGPIPTGASCDRCDSPISGTPVAAGTYNFTLTATDANGHRASQGYTVQILPAPDITVPGGLAISPLDTLRPWDTGFTNPQALAATGGIPPYSWSVAAGSLIQMKNPPWGRLISTSMPSSTSQSPRSMASRLAR